jgi:arylsulfatase A-like enzyme
LGTFLAALGEHVLDQKTAVFVTSDHGEALFERGFGNHNISLYESEIAIPLLARLPGVEPERAVVDCLVGLVDVMPTICDYFDLACPEQVSGYSVLAPDAGMPPSKARYMVAEGLGGSPQRRTIQNRRFKLVGRADPGDAQGNVAPRASLFALYDLLADPTEETNLIAEGASSPEADAVAGAMGEALLGSVGAAPDVTRGRARLDESTRERLKALGYLQE